MKSADLGKSEMKAGNRARILCGYCGVFAGFRWAAGWHTNSRNGAACVDLGVVRAYIVRNSFYFGNSYARDPLGTA